VSVSLTQPVGRIATVTGDGFAEFTTCDGSPHPWSAQVDPYGGKFAGGHATASATIFVCNESSCAYDDAQQQVTCAGRGTSHAGPAAGGRRSRVLLQPPTSASVSAAMR
jgi:hypothetical protein